MKINFKFTGSLFLFSLLLFLPSSVEAGLSETCFETVQCPAGQDYYAGSCQPHVEALTDCPDPPFGYFSGFSCDYGCYVRSRPEFEDCAGGVTVNGTCLTTLRVVNDENQTKIWDGVQLESIGGGLGEGGLWETKDDLNVYRSTGNVGIGVENPEDYSLDVAGPANLNRDLDGPALYVNQRQMLWYTKEFGFAGWGLDADMNFFGKPLGVGALPPDPNFTNFYSYRDENNVTLNDSTIFAHNTSSSLGGTYGIYSRAENPGSGKVYGAYNLAEKNGAGTAYGSYNYGYNLDSNNNDVAYGSYSIAYNPLNTGEAIAVYGSANSGTFSTGGYFEGNYVGLHAVGVDGVFPATALKVENNATDSVAASFECAGSACTSAIFYDGDDSDVNAFKSGIVIIGSPTAEHLSFDNNEIMAKQLGGNSTLYLNADGGSIMLEKGAASYKLQLANNSNNLIGRGLAYSWDTYSDDRIKRNQLPLEYGLEELMRLEPKSYDHYQATVREGQVQFGEDYQSTIGFVAQEVYDIVPEAVNKPLDEANELWTMDHQKLIPLLVKATQEQQDLIEELTQMLCQDHPESRPCL